MLEISFSHSGALTMLFKNNEVTHNTLNESIVKIVSESVRSYGPTQIYFNMS